MTVSFKSIPLLLCQLFQLYSCGKHNLAWEQCTSDSLLHPPQSQAVITGVFPVRNSLPNGLCGEVDALGLQTLEAVKWALANLNQDYGYVFKRKVDRSFVPGIQIGLDGFDSCANEDLAVQHVRNQYRDLYASVGSCIFNTTQINLGVLGPQKAASGKKISEFVGEFDYATISSAFYSSEHIKSSKSLIPTSPGVSLIGETMVGSAREFGWEEVSLVWSEDEYGAEGKRAVMEWAKHYALCISTVEKLPRRAEDMVGMLGRLFANLPSTPVVLVFAPQKSAINLLRVYSNLVPAQETQLQLQWLFSAGLSLDDQAFLEFPTSVIRGIFLVGPSFPLTLSEFEDHWTSLNPTSRNASNWMRELYQHENSCRFPDEFRPEFASLALCGAEAPKSFGPVKSNPHLIPALDAVYAFSLGLRKGWANNCRGPGLCPQMVQMSNKDYLTSLKSMEFEYGKDVRSPPSLQGRKVAFKRPITETGLFEIVQQGSGIKVTKVLEFGSGGRILSLAKPIFYSYDKTGVSIQTTTPPTSTCVFGGKCNCLETTSTSLYVFTPGDLSIAALFPIHRSGTNPYTCGGLKLDEGGYQLTEAFNYAIGNLNGKEGPFEKILPGVKLGSLILDSCQSPAISSYLLSGLLTREMAFQSGEESLHIADVQGVIGGLHDNTSSVIASIAAQSKLPHITYGAESAALNNANLYPTTVRTVLSDTTRLRALVRILQEKEWSFVQLLYSSSEYGHLMAETFKAMAQEMGICIAHSTLLTTDSAQLSQAANIVSTFPSAKVIVTFAEEPEVRGMLAAIKTATKIPFIFVSPKHWGQNGGLVDGLESVAQGAITFEVPPAINPSFKYYTEQKTLSHIENNPWAAEFVEATLDCKMDGSSASRCDPKLPLSNVSSFHLDPHANDVINSVYSLAFGLHAALQQYCGSSYRGVCTNFRSLSAEQRNLATLSAVLRMKFRDESNRIFSFTRGKDANIPINVYSFRHSPESLSAYVPMGSYPTTNAGGSILNQTKDDFYASLTSACENASQCPQCGFAFRPRQEVVSNAAVVEDEKMRSKPSAEMTEQAEKPFLFLPSNDQLLIGALFPIHSSGGSGFECGLVNEEGVLMLESFLWALDTINHNPQLLRGVKLGAFALDTCSNAAETLINLKNLFTKPGYYRFNATEKMDPVKIYSFLNAPNSETALAAADLLGAYGITNVGPDSPTDLLNNYPYTLRTSVPTGIQIDAIMEILSRFNWDYISVVYSATRTGNSQFLNVKSKTAESGVCISMAEAMSSFSQQAIDQLVVKLKAKKVQGSRAVVLFLSRQEIQLLMKGLERAEKRGLIATGELTLLGMSEWGDNPEPIFGTQSALGSVTLRYDTEPLQPLRDYLDTLNFTNNDRNPWWREFYRKKLDCNDHETCSKIRPRDFNLRSVSTNIINAVFAMAVGLGNLQQEYCRQEGGLCENLRSQPKLKQLILSKIKGVAFTRGDDLNQTFEFGSQGWSMNGLRVLNVAKRREDNTALYREVGLYRNGNLSMTIVPMSFANGKPIPLKNLKSECAQNTGCFECSKVVKQNYSEISEQVTTTVLQPKVTETKTTLTYEGFFTNTPATTLATSQAHSQPSYNGKIIYTPPSTDSFLISAVFGIHERGNGAMQCGKLISTEMQNLEAFLWAVAEINKDPVLLPGTSLGTLILDSCSQSTKAIQDLSNIFSQQINIVEDGAKVTADGSVAMVTSGNSDEEDLAVCQVAKQFHLTCVSPKSSANPKRFGRGSSSDLMVRSSVSSEFQAGVIADIVVSLSWKSIAIVYSDDMWGIGGARDLSERLQERKVCTALSKKFSVEKCSNPSEWAMADSIVAHLSSQRQSGTYGVVLWLSAPSMRCFLQSVSRAIKVGTVKAGDFSWITPAGIPDLQMSINGVELASVGLVALDSEREPMRKFEEYWKSLTLETGGKNPWRKELFDKILNCQGTECFLYGEYRENANLLNTVNAVYSIAYSLDELRKRVCGLSSHGICPELKDNSRLSEMLYETMKTTSYVDVSGHMFRYGKEMYGNHNLMLKSLIVTENGYELRKVGRYNRRQGIILDNPLQGFQNGLEPFNLRDRPSNCTDARMCPTCKLQNEDYSTPSPFPFKIPVSSERNRQPTMENQLSKKIQQPDTVIQPSNRRFYLAGTFPVHIITGETVLTCGEFNPSSGFQQMAAFLYALREVNEDPYLLPGIELGSVTMDTCSSEERMVSNLFKLFTEGSMKAENIVSVLGVDSDMQESGGQMLRSLGIPQINAMPTPVALRRNPLVMGAVPSDDTVAEIMVEILDQMKWSYVSVVYERAPLYSATGKHFERVVNDHGVCVAETVILNSDGSVEEYQMGVRQLVLAAGSRAVVLFISSKNMLKLMEAITKEGVAPARFIFLTVYDEDWTFDRKFRTALGTFNQGLLSVEVQRYNNSKFIKFLDSLSLEFHDPFPKLWFEEFWQNQFGCFLPGSPVSRSSVYEKPCSGQEKLNPDTYAQSPTILPTIMAVHSVAKGLEKFLSDNCPGRDVNSLQECTVVNEHSKLAEAIRLSNFSYSYSNTKDPMWVNYDLDGFRKTEFSVRNLLRQNQLNYQYEEVGLWRPTTGLILDTNQVRVLDSRGESEIPRSKCEQNCKKCVMRSQSAIAVSKPQMKDRFRSVWAIVIASLAGLGMIVCLVCILYFFLTFPINYGTTICGYMILFGLFLSYALSLLYIMPPTEICCTFRRVATGISWAFVFAPMLVKVIHTWNHSGVMGVGSAGGERTSPLALFCMALAVAAVQVVIGVEWVILEKSNVLVVVEGVWRCVPGEMFEKSLIASLVYVLFLIALTTLFSLLTWHSDAHNRESRWIFVSCLFTVAMWVIWTVLVTQIPHGIRDPAIAISIVTNATVILLCIYLRKAYLYQKYRQQVKEFLAEANSVYHNSGVVSQFVVNGGSVYGSKAVAGSPMFVQSVPALPPPNGQGSKVSVDPGVSTYHNAAYDGGSEFNPRGSNITEVIVAEASVEYS